MKLNIQETIANSQTTLPVVGVVSVVLWMALPETSAGTDFLGTEYGLWRFVPQVWQKGYTSIGLGVLCAAIAVYMMVELNNKNLLLRVSSRMLGSMLAILWTLAVGFHGFQPGCVLLLLSLMALFPLFESYQRPEPALSFKVFMLLSVASLMFPKLVWLVPLFWLMQVFFRTFSFRCFLASLMAVIATYWLYAGISALTDHFSLFMEHVTTMVNFHPGDYQGVDGRDVVTFVFLVMLFVTGVVDNYAHAYLDRVRTRIFYDTVSMYGGVLIVLICLQPQYADALMPLLMLNTAMVFGHFFTLTHTTYSHIYCLILMLLAIMVVTVQYVCDSHLHLIL